MKSTIFIPKKIKVGYQHRDDTYTKKLAYVIYYDNKGVLRKETSWKGWIHDTGRNLGRWENGKYVVYNAPAIQPDDFENEPTEGFVLNKKAGGYDTGWNHRQTYCRVFDPRGFEFEITIPNLLYILENTSAIKGKGLEGKFVYGWSGKDLVLIPEKAPEYVEMMEFTENLNLKMKKTDFIPGLNYLTKQNVIKTYLGYFNQHSQQWNRERHNYVDTITKKHWFAYQVNLGNGQQLTYIETVSGLSGFAKKVSDEYEPNFGDYLTLMERREDYSPIDYDELVDLTIDEINEYNTENDRSFTYLYIKDDEGSIYEVSGNFNYLNDTTNNDYYKNRTNITVYNKMSFKNKLLKNDQTFEDLNYSAQSRERLRYRQIFNLSENEIVTPEDLVNKFKIKRKKTYLQNGKEKRNN
jgi:hypothetical protein